MSRRVLGIIAVGLLLGTQTGCGSSGKYPVHGRLLYEEDGQPITELAGFSVTFTSEQLGRSSIGEIKPDGTFQLMTQQPYDGVIPGEYRVTITQPHPEPERPEKRKPFLDLMYEDPGATPLRATVEAKSDNDFTFKLRRIKPQRR